MAAKTSFPGSESEHTYVEPRTGTEVFVRRKGDLIQDVYTYRDAHFLRPIGRKGVYGIDPEFDNGRVARFLRWKTGRNDLFVHATHTGAAYDLLIQDHGFILIGEDDNNRVRGKSHLKEPQGPTRFGQEKSLADVRARITWEKWAAEKARQEGHEDLARGHDNARLDYESLLAAHSRYVVTRMKGDPKVPVRYRRSGWMAFDTLHKRHGIVWPTKAEAEAEANVLSRDSFMSRAR